MNKKKGVVFSNGMELGINPSVNFWRQNNEKFYRPNKKSIDRLHKVVSKTVNNNQANISVTTYGYELEF